MKKQFKFIAFIFLLILMEACSQPVKTVWLDDFPLEEFNGGIRPVKAKVNYRNSTIKIADVSYERGFGSITTNILGFQLNGNAKRFIASVGLDNEANKETPVTFYVIGDGKILFESGEMSVGDSAKNVDLNVNGIQRLGLLVTDKIGGVGNKGTYVNWANTKFEMVGENLPEVIPNENEKYILTPNPGEKPRINSAKIFGSTPGNPILYTIAATGKRPMQFSAENLPKGLVLDSVSGIITGSIQKKGEYITTLKAKNNSSETSKILKIVIGDKIALTPQSAGMAGIRGVLLLTGKK